MQVTKTFHIQLVSLLTSLIFSTFTRVVSGGSVVPLMRDNVAILNVTGHPNVNLSWAHSYSVGDRCYCRFANVTQMYTTYVMTPIGNKTLKEVCMHLGIGPGKINQPKYNDLQCGNGPAMTINHENVCPGRIDHGVGGCKYIGPKWNFLPKQPIPLSLDLTKIIQVPGHPKGALLEWVDSYSVGNHCYCSSSCNLGICDQIVSTPLGTNMTIRAVCDLIGPGPGKAGRPVYNDIQCGHGPSNSAGDEPKCPGRCDYPSGEGCGHLGPKWNFEPFLPPLSSISSPP